MALDFFAIASQGVFPTPTPTMARRMALTVSQGLLNITLPTRIIGAFKSGAMRMLQIMSTNK